MAVDFLVGIPVSDFAAALCWYGRLLGIPLDLIAGDTEAVWDVAERRSLDIALHPEHADHLMFSLFVDHLDARIAQIAERCLEPTRQEDYGGGVRKAVYLDPAGNEIAFSSYSHEGKIARHMLIEPFATGVSVAGNRHFDFP